MVRFACMHCFSSTFATHNQQITEFLSFFGQWCYFNMALGPTRNLNTSGPFLSFHSPFIAVPNISAQGTFHLEIGYLVLDRSGSPVPRRCRSSYSSLSPSCQLESWRNLSLTRCQPWVWRSPKHIQGMLVEWKRKQTCCIRCWELYYYAHITSRLY